MRSSGVLITRMVEDVINTSLDNLARLKPETIEDIRNAGETIVCFSAQMEATVAEIKAFLFGPCVSRGACDGSDA